MATVEYQPRMWRLPVVALIVCVSFFAITVYRYFIGEVRDVEALGTKSTLAVELGEGAPVAQQFTFPRNGLQSVAVLVWSDTPLTLELDLELRAAATSPGTADQQIINFVKSVSQPAGEAWHRFDFPAVADSKDKTFVAVFRVRQAFAPPGTAKVTLGLMAWADDALRSGRLFVGSRERWGDLAFVAAAKPPTRLERLAEGLEASVAAAEHAGRGGIGVVLVAYLGILLAVAGIAIGRLPAQAYAEPIFSMRGYRRAGAIALLAGVPALSIALFANREKVLVDLLQGLDTATFESPARLHETFGIIEEPINGYHPSAIFAHPPSRIAWALSVPAGGATLKTAVALRPQVWERKSDGVTFNVTVEDGPDRVTIYSRFLNPRENLEDRAWVEVALNLSQYAGRSIRLTLETLPGPANDSSFDWAMWAHPRIVVDR